MADDASIDIYTPLKRETSLSDRVATQLEELIVNNLLQPGDRLPPERHLAERFGVSRTVVREAVRALAAKGLLEVQSGSGTYVREYTSEDAAESLGLWMRLASGSYPVDPGGIHEVRRPFEIAMAGYAAERATDENVEELLEWVEALDTPDLTVDEFIDADVGFHRTLARATQNNLFLVILDAMKDVLRAIRELGFSVPGAAESARKHHHAIYGRIKEHDPEGARRAMEAHMDDSERIFARGLKKAQEDKSS